VCYSIAYDRADNEENLSMRRNAAGAAAAVALAMGMHLAPAAAAETGLASPWTELHAGSRMRLVAGATTPKGATAGVEIVLADGWKTYWRMPGDAGVPPRFDWKGSANVGAVKVLYPAPARLQEPAAETIGYKTGVVFPVEVTPRDASKPVDLRLAIELGICRDICVPAEAMLSLTIPPSSKAETPPALVAALRSVPRFGSGRLADDPELTRATAVLDGPQPQLTLEARFPGGAGADLFIEAPDDIYVPMSKRLPDAPDGSVRFGVDLSRGGNAQDLKGKLLRLTLVSKAGAIETTWQLP
jgi:DsbC/DsbD-like thiol-disulfide interchange protein